MYAQKWILERIVRTMYEKRNLLPLFVFGFLFPFTQIMPES